MFDSQQSGAGADADLSASVTVFVTTVGAPTFEACLAHLAAQDCRVTLRVIAHVAPMHAAFQRMLDDCTTPYFVQVDEDMLLEPHAVRTLVERIDAAGPQTAMVAGDLWDDHLRRCIIGVKIFRHATARHYPLAPLDHFEVDQVRRFEADGHTVIRAPAGLAPLAGQTLGRHGTQWTAASIYERYATLERRRRETPPRSDWFAVYGSEFLTRFQQRPTEENFFALMGVVAGTLASRQGPAQPKDYRTYGALPGLAALRAFLAAFDPPSD